MNTLLNFSQEFHFVPASTSWYLSELAEFKGKQDLYTKQSPQILKRLKEHSIIESAISSNRMEGVEIDGKRIGTVLFGKHDKNAYYRDRNEEEVAGYKLALSFIHENHHKIPLNVDTIKKLHQLTRGEIWDAGKFKERDGDIIEKYSDGRERLRFRTVRAIYVQDAVQELVALWEDQIKNRKVPPLVLAAAFNLDFLCIHPFRDGNGRVSRLLWCLQLYHLGFNVARFVSLEKIIEETKERYYETLEESSIAWHEKKHDPWFFINYMLSTLKSAYKDMDSRISKIKIPRGGKTEIILSTIQGQSGPFSIAQIQESCPEASGELIRKVLKDLKKTKKVDCLGTGKNATWVKTSE